MATPKKRVLFLCTGNSCRSQMAEALLSEIAGDRFESLSAGLKPQPSVHPMAVQVMAEVGIDISHQVPKGVEEYLGKHAVFALIVVCDRAQKTCPRVWPGLPQENRYFMPFDDPAAVTGAEDEQLAAFRRVRDEIRSALVDWVDTVEERGPSAEHAADDSRGDGKRRAV